MSNWNWDFGHYLCNDVPSLDSPIVLSIDRLIPQPFSFLSISFSPSLHFPFFPIPWSLDSPAVFLIARLIPQSFNSLSLDFFFYFLQCHIMTILNVQHFPRSRYICFDKIKLIVNTTPGLGKKGRYYFLSVQHHGIVSRFFYWN